MIVSLSYGVEVGIQPHTSRNLFMQFIGGRVGHKSTDYIQQDTPIYIDDEAADVYNKDIMLHNTQGHTQAEENVDADRDQEEVDAEGEAD